MITELIKIFSRKILDIFMTTTI